MLRLPGTHPRSLICFASGVHATLLGSCLAACACAPGRSEGAFRAGVIVQPATRLPACSHVDVSGTSQVPRRSIPCLCPALRPRPNRRSLASLTVSSMLPPRFPRRRLQRFMNFGAQSRGFSTCSLRFKNGVATTHAKLASGWLARLYREGVEPSGSLQKVSDHSSSFSGFILAQGKFHEIPSKLLDRIGRSFRLDVGHSNHLAPFFSFIGDEFSEFRRRHRTRRTTEVCKLGLHLGINQPSVEVSYVSFRHERTHALQ